MLKNILTHNIFFQDICLRISLNIISFFQDIWTEALSIPYNQLEVPLGCTRKKVAHIHSFAPFQSLFFSLSCMLQGEPPREGGQMALETDCKMATPTRFHFHQGLIYSNVLYDVLCTRKCFKETSLPFTILSLYLFVLSFWPQPSISRFHL